MRFRLFWVLAILLGLAETAPAVERSPFNPVQCEGTYKYHLQGVCASDDSLYWCFTSELVKTNAKGKIQKQIPVPGHHGDLCHHDGHIYVAVNLGKFNRAPGEADSWVYVYKAGDLSLVTRHPVPEAVHGAGGIAYHAGWFIVVGGLPKETAENYAFEYDSNFKFVKKHILKSGYTLLGIQTAAYADGHWWFGCYGKTLLKAHVSLESVERFEFECSVGIVPLSSGRVLIARGGGTKDKRYTGRLVRANTDVQHGLLIAKRESSTNWPHWRGPDANGVADSANVPVRWSQSQNVRWSANLPGWGTSSPVVYGNRIFVTSQSEREGKKSLLLLCYDLETGQERWRHDFGLGVDQRTHAKSSLAVNTPAVTADAVYVAFGNADIARYSHDGELAWVRRYMSDFGDPKMSYGYSISPVVLDDSVVFPWDHHKGPCFLIGLDKATGGIAWQKDRPIGTAHATPLFVEHHGRKELLVPGKNRLSAYDATTHEPMWQYGEGAGPFNGEIISSPVCGDGIVFLQLWRQSPIHAIRLRGDGKEPEPLWVSQNPGPVEPSLLYYRGFLYSLMDNGVLACLDGKTGAEQYRQRLGGNCNSSPIASGGRIYVSNNDGRTFVVRAGPAFELMATNDLGERITATPAISGDELIYRTDSHLYIIGNDH